MLKFLLDVLQLAIALRLGYLAIKWLIFRKKKKRRRKSVVKKIGKLITNRLHYELDLMLKKQNEALHPSKTSDGKVVPFKKVQQKQY